MYSRILMATDGSSVSELALKQAIGLARSFGSTLRIVCVIDRFSYDQSWWVSAGAFEDIVLRMRTHANEVLARARDVAAQAGVDAETNVIETDERERLSARIVKEGSDWRTDLFVLGTHGRRGMDRLVLGSVAEGVVRSASAPVLLVRSE
jgi:nucleotide-binding universal stress UspA family protein